MADKTLAWSAAESAARIAWMDQGSGSAYVLVYGTEQPAVAGDPPGGGALLRFDLAKPSGIVQADGSLTLLLASNVALGLAVGWARWARLFNGDDEAGLDLTVTSFAGAGEIRIGRRDILVGSEAKVITSALR